MTNYFNPNKTVIINKDHLLLSATEDVAEICKPLFSSTPIKYFDLTRIDKNGLINELSSQGYRSQYVYEKNNADCYMAPNISEKLLNNIKFYYFSLLDQKNKFFHKMYDLFKIDHIFILYEKYEDYYDCYCFGTSIHDKDQINFYINNIQNLVNFSHHFKEKASSLIHQFDKYKIIPPKRCQEIYIKMVSNKIEQSNNTSLSSKLNKLSDILTNREIDCLNYLCTGHTNKEIASILFISPRTVETHLNNIKIKLNVKNKNDLIKFISKMFL